MKKVWFDLRVERPSVNEQLQDVSLNNMLTVCTHEEKTALIL